MKYGHGILYYFKKYPTVITNGDEFLVISGIQKYKRKIRELKVQKSLSLAGERG
jgi:hypothetical protein